MTIEELKDKLKRKAVIFETGGFMPTNEIGESWIGAVKWKLPDDEIPKDKSGNDMLPLATLFTGYLEYVPSEISDVVLCNVFISPDICNHLINMEGYYCVKTYKSVEGLEPCSWVNNEIQAFPLKGKLVEDDYPQWDGGMDPELEDAVIELEESEGLDYYEDIHNQDYSMHKVGGYPAYIQSGDWEKHYEFMFQISSDDKAQLNIVDGGSYYFFYSKDLGIWDMQCDFY